MSPFPSPEGSPMTTAESGGLNVLSLFSGIGGLELGLERAGMTTVGQVEMNDWCAQLLDQHWPAVPRHSDVRTAPAWWASEERPEVHVVCGGFPCQPFSHAGLGLGTADERWGLALVCRCRSRSTTGLRRRGKRPSSPS